MKTSISFFIISLLFSQLLSQTNTWTGSTDTDWHKACNWSLNTIPTIAHDVTIPTVTNYPVVSANAHCRTLNITSTSANAVTIQSSLGADLCISSTNGGTCSTTATNNGGCSFHTTSTAPICENQTKALTSTVAGTFSILSGGGSIAGTTYTPPNVASNTSVTIRFDDGGGNIEDVTFTVNVLNTASNTTSTAAICETQTKALVGSPGGGSWSIVSGGGIIAGTTYTPPNVASNTTVTVRYTIPANGACPATTSDQSFTVNAELAPANNTTSTAAICETQTKALVGSPGGGSWSIVSGGGSIAGTTYTPPNVASNTNVTIRYTIPANGACPATTSDATFTVNPSLGIASNTTSTAAICETQTKALAGSPGGGSWSIVSGGGSIAGTTYTPPNVASNTNVTVRYTIPASGACAATTSDRTFTVNPSPGTASNTTSIAAICENQTKALVGSPGGGSWSIVSGGGSISGTTYTPPNVASNTSVTVRYTIPASGACPATTSDRTFTVNVLNVANNTTSTTAIDETQTKALTGTPGGGSWSIVSGGGSIAGTTYTPPDVSGPTSVTIRYTIAANGACPATTSDATFTVNDATCTNLASNPSFESFSSCPSGASQMTRVNDWYNYTATTTDYMNTCGTTVVIGNPPPSPLPDGNGYIGFHSCGSPNWVEYAGLCLSSSLVNGTTYEFSFSVASADNSNPNRQIGIFGQTTCGTLTTITTRSGTSPYETLLPRPGVANTLGTVNVTVSNSSWTRYTIVFTPTQNYPGIVVGPSTIIGSGGVCTASDYTYLDHVELCVQ